LVKADVNLAEIEDGFLPKTWITDY
jgi:hypothetical protein